MKQIHRTALVPYPAAQMFELVNDIESYPKFLPWCRSASRRQRDGGEVEATIELAKGRVHKSFTTRNRIKPFESIEMHLLDGPFRHLQGEWRFREFEGLGCKISLELEFDFSSRTLAALVGPVFSHIANSLVESFCKRADQLYARGKPA